MIHHTCDRCKKAIHPSTDVRYQIRIDVQSTSPGDDDIPSDDIDPLSALHQSLDQLASRESSVEPTVSTFTANYDLCPRCYRAFANHPLGREMESAVGFSNN